MTSNLLIIPPLHGHGISQNVSIHFNMVLMLRTFFKIESLPSLAFSTTKPCTSFKCLANNHLAQRATMQVPTLHFHFDLTFVHSLSFQTKLGEQGDAGG
jgi:hypothetical protein